VQQTIIYVKCCAHWFVCLGIFLFIAFVLFLLVVFIHLFCVRLPYGGEIKLYTISETKIAFRYKIIFQVSDISSVERRFVVVTFLPSFFCRLYFHDKLQFLYLRNAPTSAATTAQTVSTAVRVAFTTVSLSARRRRGSDELLEQFLFDDGIAVYTSMAFVRFSEKGPQDASLSRQLRKSL